MPVLFVSLCIKNTLWTSPWTVFDGIHFLFCFHCFPLVKSDESGCFSSGRCHFDSSDTRFIECHLENLCTRSIKRQKIQASKENWANNGESLKLFNMKLAHDTSNNNKLTHIYFYSAMFKNISCSKYLYVNNLLDY